MDIKHIRENTGKSLSDVAKDTGVSKQAIHQLENRFNNGDNINLKNLAGYLNSLSLNIELVIKDNKGKKIGVKKWN